MIRLDQQSLRALASPIRLDILKTLKERNHTISELAQHLNKTGPTIREHIHALARAQLIILKDTGHKWKYYELTPKGKTILSDEHPFSLDLALLLVAGSGLAYSIHRYLSASSPSVTPSADSFAADMAAQGTLAMSASGAPSPDVTLLVTAVLFALVLIIIASARILRSRRIFPSQKQAFK